MTLKFFMILWTAECCCEDIDENYQDHHDANADVYTEKEQSSNFFQKDCIDLLFTSGVAHGLGHLLHEEED